MMIRGEPELNGEDVLDSPAVATGWLLLPMFTSPSASGVGPDSLINTTSRLVRSGSRLHTTKQSADEIAITETNGKRTSRLSKLPGAIEDPDPSSFASIPTNPL